MDKSPDAYRTISEVAEDLDLPQHVLRFWETRFSQIKPMKRGGGRRYYRPDDVELVRGIRHLLYSAGYTIKGVQRILKDQGAKHVQVIGQTGNLAPLPTGAVSSATARSDEDAVSFSISSSMPEPRPVPEVETDIVPEIEPVAEPQRSAADYAASLGASGLGPLFAGEQVRPRKKPPQRMIFEDQRGDDQESGGALSSNAMARMLPSAWQGTTATSPIIARLDSALADLEECARLLALARSGVAD